MARYSSEDVALALALTAADYASVWQDFRSAAARRQIVGMRRLDVRDMPVIGINGLNAQTKLMTDAAFDVLHGIGRDEIADHRLPYPEMALVYAPLRPTDQGCVLLLGVGLLEPDRLAVVEFIRVDGHWAWTSNFWSQDANMLKVERNAGIDVDDVEHFANVYTSICVLLGLMALPTEVVAREPAPRPITKGRTRAHPLAPSSLLRLSFDPVRVVQAGAGRGGRHVTPTFSFSRRATMVTNRYGKTFTRRATTVLAHLPPRETVRVAHVED